jgi:hypothetical protein
MSTRNAADKLTIRGTALPGVETTLTAPISSRGDFLCHEITGTFTTLETSTTDEAICRLDVQLVDGATLEPIQTDYCPAETVLSPGRVKSPAAPSAAVPLGWVNPMPLKWRFRRAGQVLLKIRNTSGVSQTVTVVLHGERV